MIKQTEKKFPSIGILVHFETKEIGGYFKEILTGVLTALQQTPYDLKLIAAPRFAWINPLFERHEVKGILIPTTYKGIFPHLMEESSAKGPVWPVVSLNDCNARLPLSQFGSDSCRAMKELTEILVKKGYRRFFFLGRKPGQSPDADARFRGFLDVLRKHRLPFNRASHFADGYFSEARGYEETLKLMKRMSPDRSAIVCANDAMALGALKAIQQSGLSSPRDVGLTGFDGILETQSSDLFITTVRIPLKKIAAEACRHLLRLIRPTSRRQSSEKKKKAAVKKFLPYEILIGSSI